MPLTLTEKANSASLPVHLVTRESFAALEIDPVARAWAEANRFTGAAGQFLLLPGKEGAPVGALFGVAENSTGFAPLATGSLARQLPSGDWYFAETPETRDLASLGILHGSYSFSRYRKSDEREIEFAAPEGFDIEA